MDREMYGTLRTAEKNRRLTFFLLSHANVTECLSFFFRPHVISFLVWGERNVRSVARMGRIVMDKFFCVCAVIIWVKNCCITRIHMPVSFSIRNSIGIFYLKVRKSETERVHAFSVARHFHKEQFLLYATLFGRLFAHFCRCIPIVRMKQY